MLGRGFRDIERRLLKLVIIVGYAVMVVAGAAVMVAIMAFGACLTAIFFFPIMKFWIGAFGLAMAACVVYTPVALLCLAVKHVWVVLAERQRNVVHDSRSSALEWFPWLWESLRYLLPKRVQVAVWEPTFWELMEDYYSIVDRLEGRKWRTRWIVACFTLRTILMYVQCLRAFAADATVGWLWRTVSRIFRR